MPPLGALFWVLTLWMTEQTAQMVLVSVRPAARADIVSLTACVVLGTLLVLFAAVRLHAPHGSLRELLAFRALGPVRAFLAAAAGAGLAPAVSTLDDAILRRWPYADAEVTESIQHLVASSSRFALVAGALVIIPVAREIFFRGLIFGRLGHDREGDDAPASAADPWGKWAAVVSTTALYAMFSAAFDPREIPSSIVLGFAFARLRERTGTVLAPIVAHLAYCAVDGIPILRGRDPAADITYEPRWMLGGAVIAVLALAAVGAGGGDGDGQGDSHVASG
jgi:membrane protease YdiL (CAAX protease family)